MATFSLVTPHTPAVWLKCDYVFAEHSEQRPDNDRKKLLLIAKVFRFHEIP